MKLKDSFLLLLSLLCFQPVFSQLQLGGRIGINRSNITDANVFSEPRYGLQFGAFGLLPLEESHHFFINPELSFSALGEYNRAQDPDGSRPKQKVFANYIQVPVQIRYYLPIITHHGLFISAGPYLGFFAGKEVQQMDYPTEADGDIFSNMDYGITIGGGYSISETVSLSLRGIYGLKTPVVTNSTTPSPNSRHVFINFGVEIGHIFGRVKREAFTKSYWIKD